MKKLLILPMLLGLAACDRPDASMLVRCGDKDAVINLYDDYVIVHSDGRYNKIYATEKSRMPSGFEWWQYGVREKWDFFIEEEEIISLNKDDEKCYPMVSYVQTAQQAKLLCGGTLGDFQAWVGGEQIILHAPDVEKTLSLDVSQSDSNQHSFVSEDGWVMRTMVDQVGPGTANYFYFSLKGSERPTFNECLLAIPLK